MSSSQLLSLDFDSKTSSYIDSMDAAFPYMENGLEYLQYPPPSPPPPVFELPVGLPPSASPLGFNSALALSGDYTYSPQFNASSPERSYTPPEGDGMSTPALSYNLGNGDPASEGPSSGRHSRNSSSGSAVSYAATIPRSHRFNPIGVPANRPTLRTRRRNSKVTEEAIPMDAEEDDDDEFQPPPPSSSQANTDARRETIRKQRIESEQRRRDELRDGYTRLKETLPTSNQKSSKVSLLDRATGHIRYLETVKEQLETRLKAAEVEVNRLRSLNETLMLNSAQRQIASATLGPQY